MATRKCSNTITIDILHRISMHVYSGADTGFSKRGGWDPRYEKRCGRGGGGLSASGPIQKAGCVCVCVWGGGGDAVYLTPAIRKAEVCVCVGGGGAVRRFSPDTKSGVCVCVGGGGDAVYLTPAIRKAEVWGGGGGAVRRFSPDTKSGEWGGLLSRRGGGTLYERGGCNPQPPPPGPASDTRNNARMLMS